MGLISVVALVLAGSIIPALLLGWRFSRKALAASLIGEIAEILTVIDAHDLPEAVRVTMDQGTPFCATPPLSSVVYKASERRLGKLGAHNIRLLASFYSCAAMLSEELQALAAETSKNGRKSRARFAAAQLEQLFQFGDEALRSLRPFIEPHRSPFLIRA
jgi:hypothetical protein